MARNALSPTHPDKSLARQELEPGDELSNLHTNRLSLNSSHTKELLTTATIECCPL
jgi:hypothetical protein